MSGPTEKKGITKLFSDLASKAWETFKPAIHALGRVFEGAVKHITLSPQDRLTLIAEGVNPDPDGPDPSAREQMAARRKLGQ